MKKLIIGTMILGVCLLFATSASALWVETVPGVQEFTEVTTSATATAGTVRFFATADTVYIIDESANKSALARLGGNETVTGAWTFSGTLTTGDVSIVGDLDVSGHVDGVSFHANAFQYPVPATEWAPALDGARLPDANSAKVVYLPLNFLKAGDEIVSYTLVGDVVEASTATVDAQIYRVNKADPITTTAITGGAMTQVTVDGNFDVLTTLSAVETVVTDKQYVIQITGTTTASDAITVMGAEIVINRKL